MGFLSDELPERKCGLETLVVAKKGRSPNLVKGVVGGVAHDHPFKAECSVIGQDQAIGMTQIMLKTR